MLRDHNDNEIAVSFESNDEQSWNFTVDGRTHSLSRKQDGVIIFDKQTLRASCCTHAAGISVFADRAWHMSVVDPLEGDGAAADGGDVVVSPMPGQLRLVHVSAGDEVNEGQALLVMEAMKMEHTLVSPRDGTVEEVMAGVGDQVEDGAILLKLQD